MTMGRTRSLLLSLALGLGAFMAARAPVAAAETPVEATTAPPLTDEERAELFAPYEEAMGRGQKNQAADALLPILDAAEKAAAHGEAWSKLAELLASFDMEYSALIAYRNALEADPEGAAPWVSTAMDIAEKLGDEELLAPALAQNVGIATDPGTRSRMAYLAARYNLQQGQLGTATGILMMVDKSSSNYAESEALRGIVLAQQQRFNDALAPLFIAKQTGTSRGERFENMVTLNVARAQYGAGNYAAAIETFEQVERASDLWPEATFERAWAHFRLDDMNGALSQLHSLDTPFFDDWYFPEADLLRTYSLFMLCKFPDATKSVDAFAAAYRPVHDDLAQAVPAMSPADAWNDVGELLEGGTTRLPTKVVRSFLYEDRISDKRDTVAKADDELGRLKNVSASPFAARASEWLSERRDTLVREEGERILAQASAARDQLSDMLYNVDITKLDMMQYETLLLEQAANTGKLDFGDPIGKLRKLRKVRNTRVWPYQGEEWADEVGYYVYDVRPDCPEGLQGGGTSGR